MPGQRALFKAPPDTRCCAPLHAPGAGRRGERALVVVEGQVPARVDRAGLQHGLEVEGLRVLRADLRGAERSQARTCWYF